MTGDYSVVSSPDTDPRYIFGTNGQDETDPGTYCVSCEEFRERTQYGECEECGNHYVVTSLLEVFPANWKPGASSSPRDSGYLHSYFDVTVELHPPPEATEASPEGDTPDDENPSLGSWDALVTWPNHIPLQQERLVPDHGIQAEDEAKAWLYDLLRTVDQRYRPGELTSLGAAFGGAVETSTPAAPVVKDDLTCTTCGAYLPHYRGDSISSWYRYHYEYMDDDAHPAPEETDGMRVSDEFNGRCPHCGASPISEHGLIDHLVEHGYSRSDAFDIMNRVW